MFRFGGKYGEERREEERERRERERRGEGEKEEESEVDREMGMKDKHTNRHAISAHHSSVHQTAYNMMTLDTLTRTVPQAGQHLRFPDVQAPTFSSGCPANQHLYSGPLEAPVAVTWTDPVTQDNSGLAVTLSSSVAKGTTLGSGVHVVKIIATDTEGNSASCSFVIQMQGIDNDLNRGDDGGNDDYDEDENGGSDDDGGADAADGGYKDDSGNGENNNGGSQNDEGGFNSACGHCDIGDVVVA